MSKMIGFHKYPNQPEKCCDDEANEVPRPLYLGICPECNEPAEKIVCKVCDETLVKSTCCG